MDDNILIKLDPSHLDGWTPVLVPSEDYVAVTRFVAARQAERTGAGHHLGRSHPEGGSETAHPLLASWAAWPEDALRRLAESQSVTARRWVTAMDAIAQRDGNWFTTSEVAEISGLTINEWRDAPRKISRHLKAHYTDVPVHEGHLVWPLRPWTNPDKPGEVSWGMPPATKQRWIAIRGLDR